MRVGDNIDRRILDLLQNDFPVSIQPYQAMADTLQISEEELIARVAAMKASGLIRRIGGIIDSRRLGFYSTLCAVSVPEGKIDEAARVINQQPGVTHNYLRDHEYNMWFTLTTTSPEKSAEILQELQAELGLDIITMPAEKIYKIKVSFQMENEHDR
ncbi:MAG: AsnC family transcriptional regulator [Syntrophomonadaceae bacterium]|nr:AsnC family transcriptional regulator [Syntrophomonadaceae bacterium]